MWIAFSERSDEMVDMLSEHFFGRDSFPWDGKMKACLDVIHEIGHNVKVTYKTVPETEVMSIDKAWLITLLCDFIITAGALWMI